MSRSGERSPARQAMLRDVPKRFDDVVGLRVELFVQPMVTVGFYEQILGFTLERQDDGYWSLRNGTVELGVGAADGLAPDHHFVRSSVADSARGVGVELVLELPSAHAVDVMYQQVRSKVQGADGEIEPISDRQWGLRDFRLIDPDGYYIRVTHT